MGEFMEKFTIMLEAPDLTISYYSKHVKDFKEFIKVINQFIEDNFDVKDVKDCIEDDTQAIQMFLFEIDGIGRYTAYMIPHVNPEFTGDPLMRDWV